jgi:hypothetical protein
LSTLRVHQYQISDLPRALVYGITSYQDSQGFERPYRTLNPQKMDFYTMFSGDPF